MSTNVPKFALRPNVAHMASKVMRFGSWWVGELGAMVPAGLKDLFTHRSRVVNVQVSGASVAIDWDDGRGAQNVAMSDLAEQKSPEREDSVCVLQIPAENCLQTKVHFPAMAEEHLENVLRFEMDRITPYQYNDVYIHNKILRREERNDTVTIYLYVVIRSWLDDIVASLERGGVFVDQIHVASRLEKRFVETHFLQTTRKPQRLNRSSIKKFILIALMFVASSFPFLNLHLLSQSLDRQIEALTPQAAKTRAAFKTIAELSASQQHFAAELNENPMLVPILDHLSSVLPNDTWVTHFSRAGVNLEIRGESSDASKLIALLEESSSFSDARFTSPLTKNPRSNKDRFSLSVSWVIEQEAAQ